jgi:hypothetical protein
MTVETVQVADAVERRRQHAAIGSGCADSARPSAGPSADHQGSLDVRSFRDPAQTGTPMAAVRATFEQRATSLSGQEAPQRSRPAPAHRSPPPRAHRSPPARAHRSRVAAPSAAACALHGYASRVRCWFETPGHRSRTSRASVAPLVAPGSCARLQGYRVKGPVDGLQSAAKSPCLLAPRESCPSVGSFS